MADVTVTPKPTVCARCGHTEDDHFLEEDDSFCIGDIRYMEDHPGQPVRECNCRMFIEPSQ
jgi:hypothetical protein